jgi:phosphatidate cytidylyltransferase
MLWQRIITASILIPIVVLTIVYLPAIYFLFLVTILLTLVAWEWSKLNGISGLLQRLIYIGILWTAGVVALMIPKGLILSISMVVWVSALYFVWRYPKVNKKIFIGWSGCCLSLLIVIPCWIGCNMLYADTYYKFGIFAILIIVWSADIGAYFFGRFFGKHKLAPKVSPKKTIEGLIGGILLALFVYSIYFLYPTVDWIGWSMVSACGLYLLLVFSKYTLSVISGGKYLLNRINFSRHLKLSFWELVFVIIIAIIYCLVWTIVI